MRATGRGREVTVGGAVLYLKDGECYRECRRAYSQKWGVSPVPVAIPQTKGYVQRRLLKNTVNHCSDSNATL